MQTSFSPDAGIANGASGHASFAPGGDGNQSSFTPQKSFGPGDSTFGGSQSPGFHPPGMQTSFAPDAHMQGGLGPTSFVPGGASASSSVSTSFSPVGPGLGMQTFGGACGMAPLGALGPMMSASPLDFG